MATFPSRDNIVRCWLEDQDVAVLIRLLKELGFASSWWQCQWDDTHEGSVIITLTDRLGYYLDGRTLPSFVGRGYSDALKTLVDPVKREYDRFVYLRNKFRGMSKGATLTATADGRYFFWIRIKDQDTLDGIEVVGDALLESRLPIFMEGAAPIVDGAALSRQEELVVSVFRDGERLTLNQIFDRLKDRTDDTKQRVGRQLEWLLDKGVLAREKMIRRGSPYEYWVAKPLNKEIS